MGLTRFTSARFALTRRAINTENRSRGSRPTQVGYGGVKREWVTGHAVGGLERGAQSRGGAKQGKREKKSERDGKSRRSAVIA